MLPIFFAGILSTVRLIITIIIISIFSKVSYLDEKSAFFYYLL
nr:MAG TPA: hypothetical protein [Caudoviricetes sp.]